jgi:hypothetical protein
MELKYLAHSSFQVSCGGKVLVFDPWLKGSAYYNQWHLWPPAAVRPEDVKADAILISHGHEDHLHIESLKAIPSKDRIFFPFQWRAGATAYLKSIGYAKVTEAISLRPYMVGKVKVTYLSFSLESVIVIESENKVLVNINDALNSNHENAVMFLLKEIKTRWPKIDYLMSGWSGAGYFPNQIRYPGKDDIEIARLREQYFANNFCRFVHFLQPKTAIPFVPGFALLEHQNQWINSVKFPRQSISEYYGKHYDARNLTSFLISYPGDIIRDHALYPISTHHATVESELSVNIPRHFETEIVTVNQNHVAPEPLVDGLVAELKKWTKYNSRLYHRRVTSDMNFSIELADVSQRRFVNIKYSKESLCVERSHASGSNHTVLIVTTAQKLKYSLSKVWGGDVLSIGYGVIVYVYDQLTLEKNMDIVCLRLITRYPIASRDLFHYPVRAMRFYSYNPKLTALWMRQKTTLKPYVNKYPYNERDHWLTYRKCDLCAVCKMPEISLEAYYRQESVSGTELQQ